MLVAIKLKSDLRGIETLHPKQPGLSALRLKSDLRGIETDLGNPVEVSEKLLKSDLRGLKHAQDVYNAVNNAR